MRFSTLALAVLLAAGVTAQSPSALKFEVASIKANRSNPPMQVFPTLQPSGRVFAINLSLRELLRVAYGLRDNQLIVSSQLAELSFDLEARAGAGATRDQAVLMLRTMLAERFNLETHTEKRELPVYSLVRVNADRLGSQMKPSGAECASPTFASGPGLPPPPPPPPPAAAGILLLPDSDRMRARCPTMFFPGGMSVRGMNMAAFTVALERLVRRQVHDQTGLQGAYDFDLTYAPETLDAPRPGPGIAAGISSAPDGGPPPGAPASQSGASLFDALREQLGLRLESTRAPVEVLVIDRVQPPAEN